MERRLEEKNMEDKRDNIRRAVKTLVCVVFGGGADEVGNASHGYRMAWHRLKVTQDGYDEIAKRVDRIGMGIKNYRIGMGIKN